MRFIFIAIALIPVFVAAQSDLPDYESMTKEEIESLPQETLKKLPFLPVMRRMLADGELEGLTPDLADLMVTMYLRDLFYTPTIESDPQIANAVKAFQRDIAAPVTGELTMGQFEELSRRGVRRRETAVYASGYANVFKHDDSYVSASGTWIIEDDRIANPVNTANIECHRESMSCSLAQASVMVPSQSSSDDSYNLMLDTQSYKIISWTENEVISRPYQTNRCRSVMLTINTLSEEVYEISRNNNLEDCKFGDLFELPALEQPRVSRLVEGFKTTYDYWSERRRANAELINSEIRGRFNVLFGVKE